MAGVYKVPKPFKDEDKWGGLTKRQIFILFPAVVLGVGINVLIFLTPLKDILSIVFISMFIGFTIIACGVIIAFVPIPNKYYMIGGGYYIEKILIRLIVKKHNKKVSGVIYTRGLDESYKYLRR